MNATPIARGVSRRRPLPEPAATARAERDRTALAKVPADLRDRFPLHHLTTAIGENA